MTPRSDNIVPDLTRERSRQALHCVCESETSAQDTWSFRPAEDNLLQAAESAVSPVDTSLLLGIVRMKKNISPPVQDICTFYLAYSTWQGRVLFIDQTASVGPHEWVNILARIARQLHCERLVWTHHDKLPDALSRAETLDGWLTLHWKLPALQAFAPRSVRTDAVSSLHQAFAKALEHARHERFALRLAEATDIDIIDRLVRGLAEFENEPESYKLSKRRLLQDGFGEHPLYYCILVDDLLDSNNPYTCGMAFCYLGFHLSEGRFLYLEDLFFEKAFRGKGGGRLAMTALALAAQSLQCTKAVWQALDWNTPAL